MSYSQIDTDTAAISANHQSDNATEKTKLTELEIGTLEN